MFFIYPTPQHPRKPLEYVFKVVYQLLTCFYFVTLALTFIDFYTRLDDSLPGYYRKGVVKIHPSIATVMENCTYHGTLRTLVKMDVDLSLDGFTIGLANMAKIVTIICIIGLLQFFTSIILYSCYAKSTRHLRFFGVHFPLYHVLALLMVIYPIAIIFLVVFSHIERGFFQDAVTFCAAEARKKDPTILLRMEYDNYTILTTVIYYPLVASCLGLAVSIASASLLFYFSSDKAIVLLSQSDAPWESRTAWCTTNKSVLRLHTTQRNAILKDARTAMKDGLKVRIVRSYQLMSESDFQALAKAMQLQVERGLKQKQFESLNEYFGDNESQIDKNGLTWRQNVNRALPQSPEDVDEANYFDDVEFVDENNHADHFDDRLFNKNSEGQPNHSIHHSGEVHNPELSAPHEEQKGWEGHEQYFDPTASALNKSGEMGQFSPLQQSFAWDEHFFNPSVAPAPPDAHAPGHPLSTSHPHHDSYINDQLRSRDFRDQPAACRLSHYDNGNPSTALGENIGSRHQILGVDSISSHHVSRSILQTRQTRNPNREAKFEDEIVPADTLSAGSDKLSVSK